MRQIVAIAMAGEVEIAAPEVRRLVAFDLGQISFTASM